MKFEPPGDVKQRATSLVVDNSSFNSNYSPRELNQALKLGL